VKISGILLIPEKLLWYFILLGAGESLKGDYGNNRYNPEIEDALIACVLKDGSCFSSNRYCDTNDFYWKPYSWIWQCFTSINERE